MMMPLRNICMPSGLVLEAMCMIPVFFSDVELLDFRL